MREKNISSISTLLFFRGKWSHLIWIYYFEKNRLLLGIFKPPRQNDSSFLNEVEAALNLYSKSYGNFLLVGNFNMFPNNSNLKISRILSLQII